MSCEIEQAPAVDQVPAVDQAHAFDEAHPSGQPNQLPPMTPEAARRLAAVLAPHLLAMRVVTAGTRYGACAGTNRAATNPAAAAQLPPASAATRIFIAGMLERISA